jgi:hypothetical protein
MQVRSSDPYLNFLNPGAAVKEQIVEKRRNIIRMWVLTCFLFLPVHYLPTL